MSLNVTKKESWCTLNEFTYKAAISESSSRVTLCENKVVVSSRILVPLYASHRVRRIEAVLSQYST